MNENQAKIIRFTSRKRNFDSFIQSLESEGKSPLTIRQYRSSWNRFVEWFEGHDPTEATQKDIADFKRHMIDEGKSPNTQRQTLTHLKAFFRYLEEGGEVIDNPVDRIEAVKIARETPKWLNRQEQNELLRKIRKYGNIRELAIVCLMLQAGLRVQELVDLRRNDIAISERKGVVTVRDGKHERFRKVALNKDLRQVLSDYMGKYDGQGEAPLFTSTSNNSKGKSISTRAVQQLVAKYKELTKIEQLTCHALRHSFGHDLVEQGVSLDQVAMLLGHMKSNGLPNIEMTMIYTQPSEDDLQSAVERLSWT